MPEYSNPATLPSPYGLYSHMAHSAGSLHFVAGQLPINEDGSLIGADDFAAQLKEVFERIEAAARSVGLGLENAVQFTTYLAGRELVPEFYKARQALFDRIYPNGGYPPNTLVVVAGLVEPGVLVEVQTILGR
jgi:enamine deaminase RidA (YjgF/YER057c/UK114 family)